MLTKSHVTTERLAEGLAKKLKGGETLLLFGDLGAGKTVFTRGLARALGFSGLVTSPTFTLHNVYEGGRLTVDHFDLYRLSSPSELDETSFCDVIGNKNSVAVIEWSENGGDRIPKRAIRVAINKVEGMDNRREIEIVFPSDKDDKR